ncbi:Transcriptional regulatory protein sin3 [Myotisia sp. PD_48]|nr:Transcriptional regulatory protein sin3 [Myotisia sp. PD_48]
MNPSNKDGWHSAGRPQPHHGVEQLGQQPSRPLGSFGQNPPLDDPSSKQPSRTLPPPPPGPYHPATQPSSHTLPTLADLTQGAAAQPPHQQPPRYGQHQQPPLGRGHQLPGIGQTIQHSTSPPSLNRDRERRPRPRELEMMDMERDMEREMHREPEMIQKEREMAERYHREQQQPHPVQSHTGSIPIHQPVASKIPSPIHGPNGLLSNLGAAAASNPPPQSSMQASNPPANLFGGHMQHPDGPQRQYLQHPQPVLSFNGPPSQGQQPILNQDALSYLDQVKVRFVEQPEVYTRFLDIMKDFKSQAIDTPGVIQRVSTLFNGHPALIQGFNTFLPSGYRIECGTDDNPDAIRVTTPSGTDTITMQPGPRPSLSSGDSGQPAAPIQAGRPEYYDQARGGWPHGIVQQPQQVGPSGPAGSYSPKNRLMPMYAQQPGPGPVRDSQYEYPSHHDHQQATEAALVHQQEQRGVSQLQNAVSAATSGRQSMMQLPAGHTPNQAQQVNSLAGLGASGVLSAGQVDASKRGPVEFNHAISYVNKIKNRFSDSPEIYKQFLEILQTYQRESKPIQDVYTQVTHLFNAAPDLLEDFKQFLPESAAQAKAQAASVSRQAPDEVPILSNIRGEPSYSAAGLAQPQLSRGDVKMPPLGQFNVKDATKESKKRRGGPGTSATGGASMPGIGATGDANGSIQIGKNAAQQIGGASKRTKLNHRSAVVEAPPAISPTLIPALPEPIPPSFSLTPSHEEYAFFDRVKKFIANKQTFGEFLKLCNLYSADLIDRNVLVNRAAGFIGANQEIMSWFKRFMNIEPQDEVIEPKAKPDTGIVNLSHCRALGPSYRLLPKRERQKPCSGRDELCKSVLNDDWASHPTWASEDSGFVAHRKNQYEDALHRIEEDRHDYDHHIEACIRTIQLLEPLVQQISLMSEAERAAFKLPPGLGGQSETIYRRVIKKIYDREPGQKVIEEMFTRPCIVLPIVLARLKQKCEEWKATQREWDKVWREQMQKGFWRSLDHQAIIMKGSDKKLFLTKHIHHEIQTKFEEGRAARKSALPTSSYQINFPFDDSEVILDATHLLLTYLDHNSAGFGADPQKVTSFIKDFIPVFFSMDRESFKHYLNEVYDSTPPSEADDESVSPDELPPRSKRIPSGRRMELLREVLERRGEKPVRLDQEMSGVSSSRASSPALVPTPGSEQFDVAELRWMEHPSTGNFHRQREYPLNEPYQKKVHHLYCNLTIYCFLYTFEILYRRLLRVKQHEKDAREMVRRAMAPKAALELGMIDKTPADLLYDADPKANLYQQVVRMCEDVITGNMESSQLEEALRRYYMKTGWQLYNLDRILGGISKFAGGIFNGDPKDRSSDIINLFYKERDKTETTHNREIQYRKQVERLIKEGDIYRITYVPANKNAMIQLLTPEESTLDAEGLGHEARWSYYVSAYTMRDPTEGVIFSDMRMPFLKRNLPPKMDSDEEYNNFYKPLIHHDGLSIRICANSYHILYDPGTEDWWYRHSTGKTSQADSRKDSAYASLKEKRKDRFKEKFVNNPSWAHGLSKDDVDRSNQQFRSWVGSAADEKKAPSPTSGLANTRGSRATKGDEDREQPDVDQDMNGVERETVAVA